MERKTIINGLVWKFGERIVSQGVSFIISLVLARLMLPEDYGTVSLVLVFINLANVFVTYGLGDALIQKKDADEIDFSTIFICSCILSLILFGILYFTAPIIADFYKDSKLTSIIRVLSVQVPLSAVKTIQHAYVSKQMQFRKFFFSTLGGAVISGTIGIAMAYKGLGVWALVAQYIINNIIDILVLFFIVPWRPKPIYDHSKAKSLVNFGWKVMVSQFVNTFYGELRSLIIGKLYTTADLAYYNKGNQFPSVLITNINTSISAVLFPALSNVNDDKAHVKSITRKSMMLSSYVLFPMMIGLIAVAEPLVKILLTENWIESVPYLQICCLYWMCQPCQTANVQAMMALGRSDICLKLEVVKKIIGVLLIVITMNINVMAVVISNVVFAVISMLINIVPNKKLIGYGYKEQFKDLAPNLFISVVMGGIVYLVSKIQMNDYLIIGLQLMVGFIIYIIASYITHNESFFYILKIGRETMQKRGDIK